MCLAFFSVNVSKRYPMVIAFNRDGTIRTFFKPNDGERYYRRQAERGE